MATAGFFVNHVDSVPSLRTAVLRTTRPFARMLRLASTSRDHTSQYVASVARSSGLIRSSRCSAGAIRRHSALASRESQLGGFGAARLNAGGVATGRPALS